jgi:hypothetical protein
MLKAIGSVPTIVCGGVPIFFVTRRSWKHATLKTSTQSLFSTILDIRDSTLDTVVDEIELWAQESPGTYNPSYTQEAYKYISSHVQTDEDLKTMR